LRNSTKSPKEETLFEKFQKIAKKIVAVPKKEADAVAKRKKAEKAVAYSSERSS
jgi:hypothetical protein